MALVQSKDDDDDSELDMGAPAAATYESKSGSIVDVLADMKDKAESELDELRKAEGSAKHNFNMLKQSLEDQIAAAAAAAEKAAEKAAAKEAAKAAAVVAAAAEAEEAAAAKEAAKAGWAQGESGVPQYQPGDIEVSGCGREGINGTYRRGGLRDGVPCYKRVGGGRHKPAFTIERTTGDAREWSLCIDYGFESYCFVKANTALPPADGWTNTALCANTTEGADAAPSLSCLHVGGCRLLGKELPSGQPRGGRASQGEGGEE